MSHPELFPTDEHTEVTPTQIEFARLVSLEQAVRTMRQHQIEYFKTRKTGELIQAKEWKKRVDKLIEVTA